MSDLNLNQIQSHLNKLFITYGERKLVFWFDPKKEFEEDIDNGVIQLENARIKKIEPQTQFLIKRFFELEDRDNNYLIYAPFKQMSNEDENNHLLSILKYSSIFNADRIALVMDQLKIPTELHETMATYSTFFGAKSRIQGLEKLAITNMKTKEEIITSLMAVLTKTNTPHFTNVIQALFVEYAAGEEELYLQLEKYDLLEKFWEYVEKYYGYKTDQPTIQKLILCFYSNAIYGQIGHQELPLNLKEYEVIEQTNAIVSFMDLFMNDRRYVHLYDRLSEEVYRLINGDTLIGKIPVEELIATDIFEPVHQKLIHYYIGQLISGDTTPMISGRTIQEVVINKKRAHFGDKYFYHYDALLNAQFLLNETYQAARSPFSVLVKDYEETTYAIDQSYRKFIWNIDQLERDKHFIELEKIVEQQYKVFLDEISRAWNDRLDLSVGDSILDFYQEYSKSKIKTVVIISDALRYEAAKEIQEVLQQEKKYTTKMNTIFSVLPSVTEFGKAASLRSSRETLEYIDGIDVRVDGQKTAGTINRDKILKAKNPNSLAITYEEVIAKGNAQKLRELFNGQEIIYLYHDQIDRTGDHGQESQVFDAVQKTIDDIRLLLPRISNGANVYRFIITSDHGFIYTRSSVEEHDKIENPSIDEEDRVERRFIISHHQYDEFGIERMRLGDVLRNGDNRFIHYPKTSTIFKKKGGGQNYVHGGSSPQEMLVPVLEVTVARGASAKEPVGIQLMTTKRKVVGLSVSLEFYQTEAISDTVTKGQYQLYFEDEQGNRISNEQAYHADSYSLSASERFTNVTFDFVNRSYGISEKVSLVIKNIDTQVEMDRVEFIIDNPFAGDFGFDF